MMTHNFVSCRIMTHHFVSCKIMTHNFDSSEKNGTISIAGKNSDSQLWACTPWERRATFGGWYTSSQPTVFVMNFVRFGDW